MPPGSAIASSRAATALVVQPLLEQILDLEVRVAEVEQFYQLRPQPFVGFIPTRYDCRRLHKRMGAQVAGDVDPLSREALVQRCSSLSRRKT